MIAQLFTELHARLNAFGHRPICNLRADRAPCIGSFCFPLCWRCTSIIFVFFVANRFLPGSANRFLLLGVMLCAPAVIDAVLQYWGKLESTTFRRVTTGVLAGIGLVLVCKFFTE